MIYFSFFLGVTEGTDIKIKGITDGDVISISKKITTLEMKELNERQRAEHAVNIYEQQKSLLHNMESRNKELEDKFSEVNQLHHEKTCFHVYLFLVLAQCSPLISLCLGSI